MKVEDGIICFEHVWKGYGGEKVLQDFSLCIGRGEFLTVIGRSGCGKTTALKLINGLLAPDKGRILVEGIDIAGTDQIVLRRRIGYVIQSIGLFPHMTVAKNIAYVPSLEKKKWKKEEERKKVEELLEIVGLPPNLASRFPDELSGGQKQRVGIARALAAEPKILLMDEPFGAVDDITRRTLQEEIRRLHKKLQVTIVFITHDMKEALKLGTKMLVMDKGKVVQYDTPLEIAEHPANDFVGELVGVKELL